MSSTLDETRKFQGRKMNAEVRRLSLRQGNVAVFEFPRVLTSEACTQFVEQWRRAYCWMAGRNLAGVVEPRIGEE